MAEGLIYHMTPTNLKIVHAWVSTGHFCIMKIRLRKSWLSVLAEWKVPQRRNCWWRWCDEFMIDYDGYWLCSCAVYDMVYVIKHLWINEHALHFKTQMDCGSLVSITWSGIGNVIGVAGCYWRGDGTCCGIGYGVECGWGQEVGHAIHGTNPYPSKVNNNKSVLPTLRNDLEWDMLGREATERGEGVGGRLAPLPW